MSDKQIEILIGIGIAVAVFVVGIIAIKIILVIMKKALAKTKIDAALHRFIINAMKIVLWVILIIIVLGKLSIPTAPIVTVLGVGSAAVALALKDSLGNVAGGIMILVTKPFEQGDYIDIGGTTGVVQHIDLLLTTMNTYDNKVITIPNGIVTTAVLTNYSKKDTRRVDTIFGIGYNDDVNKAKNLMLAVAESNSLILKDPDPFIGVARNGDNAVELDFRVWVKTEDYWDVKYFLEENIKLAFDEAGLSIPFPQMDVHIKK